MGYTSTDFGVDNQAVILLQCGQAEDRQIHRQRDTHKNVDATDRTYSHLS